jgi:hypothetical protein
MIKLSRVALVVLIAALVGLSIKGSPLIARRNLLVARESPVAQMLRNPVVPTKSPASFFSLLLPPLPVCLYFLVLPFMRRPLADPSLPSHGLRSPPLAFSLA